MSQAIPVYQIDAFADRPFTGNPAAVCPLETRLPESTMQAIAFENNLSETAFFAPTQGGGPGAYDLRWFTPKAEVDLCGHATLASGHLLLNRLTPDLDKVIFATKSGPLEVSRSGDLLAMNFPARPPEPIAPIAGLAEAIGVEPQALLKFRKTMAVLADEDQVRGVEPDFDFIAGMDSEGLLITAPGDDCDFVSRYFAPHVGIDEDPVTGSAHCVSVPYWAKRLGKQTLRARQVSARGGELLCRADGERVEIAGKAVLFLEGQIRL